MSIKKIAVVAFILLNNLVGLSQELKQQVSISTNFASLIQRIEDRQETTNWFNFPQQDNYEFGVALSYGLRIEDIWQKVIPVIQVEYSLQRFSLLGGDYTVAALHFATLDIGSYFSLIEDVDFLIGIENSFKFARNNFADDYPFVLTEDDVDKRFRKWNPGFDFGARFLLKEYSDSKSLYLSGTYTHPIRNIYDDRGISIRYRKFQIGIVLDI